MRIWCSHKPTITDGGETVCAGCGVVLSQADHITQGVSGESRANLYELREVGSRDAAPPGHSGAGRGGDLRRYFRGGLSADMALSRFSNMCEKLRLPMGAQENAWRLYSRAAGGGSMREAAEHACWAIHNTCRSYGIPIPDTEIKSAAMSAYGRGRLPDMLTMSYRHMGVPGAATEGSDSYYFNLNLRRLAAGVRLTEAEFAEMKAQAWEMYRHVFVEGSADSRARRAVSAAFGV